VRYARPLCVDLGGIAKGYAVDVAIAALRAHAVTSARVNAGGDLRVIGPEAEPVHVRTGGPNGVLMPLASVVDGAVATSAFAGARRRVAGRWITPLIDPRPGLPVMSTRTVSVIAPTCMVADALTKVVALRGAAASPALARHDAAAIILSPAAGRWRCTRLPREPRRVTRSRLDASCE
jgi:thiamine biosynthesis lipoprotein